MNAQKKFIQKLTFVAVLALLLPATVQSQSLWHDDTSRSIFADKRSLNVGDIITIAISENTTANQSDSTATERKSSLSAAITAFLYPAGATPLLTKGGSVAGNGL